MQYIRQTDRLGTTHSTDDKRQTPKSTKMLHPCSGAELLYVCK